MTPAPASPERSPSSVGTAVNGVVKKEPTTVSAVLPRSHSPSPLRSPRATIALPALDTAAVRPPTRDESPAALAGLLSASYKEIEELKHELAVAQKRAAKAERLLAAVSHPSSPHPSSKDGHDSGKMPEAAIKAITDAETRAERAELARDEAMARLKVVQDLYHQLDDYLNTAQYRMADARAGFRKVIDEGGGRIVVTPINLPGEPPATAQIISASSHVPSSRFPLPTPPFNVGPSSLNLSNAAAGPSLSSATRPITALNVPAGSASSSLRRSSNAQLPISAGLQLPPPPHPHPHGHAYQGSAAPQYPPAPSAYTSYAARERERERDESFGSRRMREESIDSAYPHKRPRGDDRDPHRERERERERGRERERARRDSYLDQRPSYAQGQPLPQASTSMSGPGHHPLPPVQHSQPAYDPRYHQRPTASPDEPRRRYPDDSKHPQTHAYQQQQQQQQQAHARHQSQRRSRRSRSRSGGSSHSRSTSRSTSPSLDEMLLEAADGSEERERRRSGSPDYRDRRRERYPPGAYGVNGHYGAPPPHAMGPGSYHAGYPHASGAMPPGPLPAPGQLQTYQTHIFAPPVTGAPVKKPKGGAPPMPLPGPGTAPQGHAVQQQPLVPAGSTGSVMTLGPNGSVISGPSTVGGPGGFPPTNNSGQRICRQCGVAGRYKDGKCVEKWGPGPEGPGTVCDRCRKKMKRVERRGTMEAQQIARGDAAALAHHHSIPRQPPTAVGLQRTGTEALSVPAPQGPGLGPHGTQLLSPRGSFREVTNTGVGAAVNGTSARKSSSPYTSARRHFSPPYGHGTSDRHRAKSHSGSSVSGSPLSQPSGASSTEKVPSPELRDSRTGNNAMEVDEGDADAEGDEIDADADGETNVEGEAEVDAEADADAELLEAVDAAEAAHAGDD